MATWSPKAGGNPTRPNCRTCCISYSKSFCSTAAGFAVDEKRFSLDDRVVSFFPEERPADLSPNLALMRVRDLLAMASGHVEEPARTSDNWVRSFFEKPVVHAPGTHFLYNSMATYMVAAILFKVTGQRPDGVP